MQTICLLILSVAISPVVLAQSGLRLQALSLESFTSFDNPGSNWKLADEVYSDVAVHHDLEFIPGTGILVNQPSENEQSNLFTNFSHGDIEIELEFMMPKGSNSGIYLQGRYEVQLLDSWKRLNVTFGDLGGIYQRWDETESKGFEGRPPRINASRAPGLWQSLRIVFNAPQFNEHGHKVRHARFVRVILNGSIVQENVTITGPTRAAGFQDESPHGPLMIQGDHGPIAFRNIRYRMTGKDSVSIHQVMYQEYTDKPLDEVIWSDTGLPASAQKLTHLQDYVATSTDSIALRYVGQISIPADGLYRFNIILPWISGDPHWSDRSIGGASLRIAGREILRHDRNTPSVHTTVALDAGIHPFKFGYFKTVGRTPPQVTLSVEGPTTRPTFLLRPSQKPAPAEHLPVTVDSDPVLLRGFITHQEKKHTHAIAVGSPDRIHYSLDLSTASLLHAWRGPFADAAPMWHNRGHEQTILPLGSLLTFSRHSVINDNKDEPLQFTGYHLTPNPVFTYLHGGVIVEDHILPRSDGSGLSRTLKFTGRTDERQWIRIAASHQIYPLSDGRYAIDGFSWYIETDSDVLIKPFMGIYELMILLEPNQSDASAHYAIVWQNIHENSLYVLSVSEHFCTLHGAGSEGIGLLSNC
ncbi:MAG: DUF1080 domain-containing protein [Bacteroidetes bacterium]|nr:DUF1080 domain-containing protein [Bacteroidota bacterium]